MTELQRAASIWEDPRHQWGWWGNSAIRGWFNPLPKAPNVANRRRVRWPITMVVMDGNNMAEARFHAYEARGFIEKYSRLKIDLNIIAYAGRHDYYSHTYPSGQVVYNMLRDQIPLSLRNSLPVSNTFLFLYKLFGRLPLQYGSTMGVPDGIPSPPFGTMSIMRPYATIATDTQGYRPEPFQGFPSQKTQIVAHEFINTINCVTSWTPWNLTVMTGTSTWSSTYEAERLMCLTDADYNKLLDRVLGQE